MDSAGRRVSKPPDRLTYNNILQPEIRTQPSMAPAVTTSTPSISTNTVTPSSGQPVPPTDTIDRDQKIHAMFSQLMAEARSNKAERAKDKEDLMSRFDQCLERWQGVDTRLVKLEDDQVRAEHHMVQQDQEIGSNKSRIGSLEDEVIFIRNDLTRLTTQINRVN